ncbi:MAG: hypothetical protein NUV46_04365 [Nanoarchaeota archaeon]|nr:hypothetical protein [Nanoarchaeota archaeon]
MGFTFATLTGFATEVDSSSNITIASFTVLAETFNGSTTNFSGNNESTYRNFPFVTLEKTSYGKVEFNENLDLVTMGGSELIVNFDRDLNLSDNLVLVDNSNLSGINKSANLSIYGITFSSPLIYNNGVICSDCTFISYSGGIYKFQVSSFDGVYWLVENPSTPVCGNGVVETGEVCDSGSSNGQPGSCNLACSGFVPTGGGGSGGGGGTTPTSNVTPATSEEYNFVVNPDFFELKMDKGTYYQQTINLTNMGSKSLTILISVEELQNFIFPQERSISVLPGESIPLRFDVYVSESREADVYVGKIHFFATEVQKDSEVVLQVNERDALFDIRTEVLKKYVVPGGRVRANVTLINKGDLRNFDVQLEYKVIDFDRNEYTLKKEDFAIDQSYNDVFFLDLPKNISIGNYLFYTQVRYGEVNASSYDTFVVEEVSTFSWFLLIIIIILSMYLAYRIYRHMQRKELIKISKKLKSEKSSEKIRSGLPKEVPLLPDKL